MHMRISWKIHSSPATTDTTLGQQLFIATLEAPSPGFVTGDIFLTLGSFKARRRMETPIG